MAQDIPPLVQLCLSLRVLTDTVEMESSYNHHAMCFLGVCAYLLLRESKGGEDQRMGKSQVSDLSE